MRIVFLLPFFLFVQSPNKGYSQSNSIGSGISMAFDGTSGNYIDLDEKFLKYS